MTRACVMAWSCWRSMVASGEGGGEVADPDAADEADVVDAVGERGGDDDRDVGLLGLLVVAELLDPGVAPVLVVLGFPEERAALAAGGADVVDDVGAALARLDG